jgi:hypothetical protein
VAEGFLGWQLFFFQRRVWSRLDGFKVLWMP